MSDQRKRLQGLSQLAEAALLAQQARMARIRAEEAAILHKLEALQAGRRQRIETLSDGPDAAAQAGADPLWHRWVDGRRAALNGDLARQRVAEERARADLARAFGRGQATRALVDRAIADEAQRKNRRNGG